jgi:hypothetical protein
VHVQCITDSHIQVIILCSSILLHCVNLAFDVSYFSIDNAHPNIFITPFDVQIKRICQIVVERKVGVYFFYFKKLYYSEHSVLKYFIE